MEVVGIVVGVVVAIVFVGWVLYQFVVSSGGSRTVSRSKAIASMALFTHQRRTRNASTLRQTHKTSLRSKRNRSPVTKTARGTKARRHTLNRVPEANKETNENND
jgi:hypothetical protein